MSVFVESSQRLAGLARRARGVPGDGLDDRKVRQRREALSVECRRARAARAAGRGSASVSVSAIASTNVGSSSGVL